MNLIVRGIRLGWIDDEELSEIMDYLRRGNNLGIEELLFEFREDRLFLKFMDEIYFCRSEQMIEELAGPTSR